MPSRKEIQWSQLRVGALVLAAMVVLIAVIFLISGSTGGLFSPKLRLRAFFPNASGLKTGAPVTLEGVTVFKAFGRALRQAAEADPRLAQQIPSTKGSL